MLPTLSPASRLTLELYSYRQLSRLWHRAVPTIKSWVCRDRAAGVVIYGRYNVVPGRRRREFLIRGDSVQGLADRHLGIRAIPRRGLR